MVLVVVVGPKWTGRTERIRDISFNATLSWQAYDFRRDGVGYCIYEFLKNWRLDPVQTAHDKMHTAFEQLRLSLKSQQDFAGQGWDWKDISEGTICSQ